MGKKSFWFEIMSRITIKSVDINKKVTAKDTELANKLRSQFNQYNITAIDIVLWMEEFKI